MNPAAGGPGPGLGGGGGGGGGFGAGVPGIGGIRAPGSDLEAARKAAELVKHYAEMTAKARAASFQQMSGGVGGGVGGGGVPGVGPIPRPPGMGPGGVPPGTIGGAVGGLPQAPTQQQTSLGSGSISASVAAPVSTQTATSIPMGFQTSQPGAGLVAPQSTITANPQLPPSSFSQLPNLQGQMTSVAGINHGPRMPLPSVGSQAGLTGASVASSMAIGGEPHVAMTSSIQGGGFPSISQVSVYSFIPKDLKLEWNLGYRTPLS